MKITWAFVLIAVSCALIVAWGNWKERTTKTKTLITGVKFIGLGALMLAPCIAGNYLMILVAVAVLLFVLVGAKCGHSKSVYSINKLMLAGAVIGFFISHSASHFAEAVNHKGPGIVDYTGGYGKYGGLEGDAEFYDDFEQVSESEYKRHEYVTNGMMLGLAVLAWVYVAEYAKEFIPPTGNPES